MFGKVRKGYCLLEVILGIVALGAAIPVIYEIILLNNSFANNLNNKINLTERKMLFNKILQINSVCPKNQNKTITVNTIAIPNIITISCKKENKTTEWQLYLKESESMSFLMIKQQNKNAKELLEGIKEWHIKLLKDHIKVSATICNKQHNSRILCSENNSIIKNVTD